MPRPKGLPKTGGKQKGYKAPKTLAKEAAREAARVRITARMVQIGQTPNCQHVWNRVDDRRTCVACQQQDELRPKMAVEDTAAFQQLQREKTARKH